MNGEGIFALYTVHHGALKWGQERSLKVSY